MNWLKTPQWCYLIYKTTRKQSAANSHKYNTYVYCISFTVHTLAACEVECLWNIPLFDFMPQKCGVYSRVKRCIFFVVEGVWIILSPAKNHLSLSIVNERPSWFAWFKAFKSETYVTSLGFSSCCSKSCEQEMTEWRAETWIRASNFYIKSAGSKWFKMVSLISSSCFQGFKVPGLRPLILKIMFVDCACE